ncbi:MAG: hypothetical protein KIS66_09155 [Fimbriimonadaceae bacterium]|nr:hypothetical protein [Fimbriimonadaceae bacterium]
MVTRREAMAQVSAMAAGTFVPLVGGKAQEPVANKEDLAYLRGLGERTLAMATKSESVVTLGFACVTPGGNYPSCWVRDFSMAAGCGLVSADSLGNHLRLIARSQAGSQPRRLGERATIPPYAIPDHVNYDGGAVFYPGTYSSGDDQGGEPFGKLPPVDDHYEFVHLAHLLWRRTRSANFLDERIGDLSLFERLEKALDCPRREAETGLVETAAADRAVGFGFCDTVHLTGKVLFPSLLRHRALGEMVDLAKAAKRPDLAVWWSAQRSRITKSLRATFFRDGWLLAATEVGRQPDVWGTAYAVAHRIAPEDLARCLRRTLVQALRAGTIAYHGAVRHVPTDLDFSPNSAWERTAGVPKNRYQNGAYWHVATGWLVEAIWKEDPAQARKLIAQTVSHFREEEDRGAPWECLHPDGGYRQNAVYLASVNLLLESLHRLAG